jgi:hypothetical protein
MPKPKGSKNGNGGGNGDEGAVAAAPKPKRVPKPPPLKIKYPKITVFLRLASGKGGPLTVEESKDFLGWEAETKKEDGTPIKAFGDKFLLKDFDGNKVRCLKNVANRPFQLRGAQRYAQDVLKRFWADSRNGGKVKLKLADEIGGGEDEFDELTINGETIIISREGLVLSGQHRLVGLVLAGQMWDSDPRWKELYGPDEPTMECVIVVGISKHSKVVRTLDNVIPRTDSDVLYTEGYYSEKVTKDRKALNRMLGYAARFLWERVKSDRDKYSRYRTIGEEMDFVSRHPKLVEMVEHLSREDSDAGNLRFYLPFGKVVGLYYLMACSATPKDKVKAYFNALHPSESFLDFSMEDKANEFWVLLSGRGPKLGTIDSDTGLMDKSSFMGMLRPRQGDKRKATGQMWGSEGGEDDERMATIINAWKIFLQKPSGMTERQELKWFKENLTFENLKFPYKTTAELYGEDGSLLETPDIAYFPDVGGIDMGPPDKPKEKKAKGEKAEEGDEEGAEAEADTEDEFGGQQEDDEAVEEARSEVEEGDSDDGTDEEPPDNPDEEEVQEAHRNARAGVQAALSGKGRKRNGK